MALPTTNLTVEAVCTMNGTAAAPYAMSSLQNSTKFDGFTVPSTNISMSLFLGATKYVNPNIVSGLSVNPTMIYSVRRVLSGYAGPLVEVRHATNGAQCSVVCDSNGVLSGSSVATITVKGSSAWTVGQKISFSTFYSGVSCYVTRFYDQVGALDFVQTNYSSQPRIVNNGAIDMKNSKPTIYFNGTTYLATANTGTTRFSTAFTLNMVAGVNTDVTNNTFLSHVSSYQVNPCPWDMYNNQFLVGDGLAGSWQAVTLTKQIKAINGFAAWTFTANATTQNAYYGTLGNGSLSGNLKYATIDMPIYLGSRYDAATGLNGWVSEVIIYSNTIINATDRGTLVDNQKTYYTV